MTVPTGSDLPGLSEVAASSPVIPTLAIGGGTTGNSIVGNGGMTGNPVVGNAALSHSSCSGVNGAVIAARFCWLLFFVSSHAKLSKLSVWSLLLLFFKTATVTAWRLDDLLPAAIAPPWTSGLVPARPAPSPSGWVPANP